MWSRCSVGRSRSPERPIWRSRCRSAHWLPPWSRLLTGLVCLRTSGAYFIMITLAFNQMLYYFFVALQKYGGEDGLQILGNLHLVGFDIAKRVPFYYLCLVVLA